ncbi:MAG: DUF2007 domain-containing protein [Planctomycetota bacterium]
MSDRDPVVVHTASDHFEARLLAGLLEAEGITARVPGSELTDEFGMAAKLSGAAEVVVLERDLARAKDIVEAWKAGPAPDGER